MPEPALVHAHRVARDLTPIADVYYTVPNQRERLAGLTAEALRIARRRVLVETALVRARSRPARTPAGRVGGSRMTARAVALGVAFHRVLDQLQAAGRYDEALAIFRAYRADLSLRLSRTTPRRGRA